MTKHLRILFIALLLGATACSSNHKGEVPAYSVSEDIVINTSEESIPASGFAQEENVPPQEEKTPVAQKLIKEGNIAFETKNMAASKKTISEAVTKNNAYISSERESDEGYRISAYVTIRVPFKNFDVLLESVGKGVEHFDEKDIRVTDVTAQYYDLEVRIKNKKALEERYLSLLKQAKTVTEMLEIEREIGNLRGDIESMEGQMKLLSNQIAYSTLNITYYKKIPGGESRFEPGFKSAFRNGWEGFVMFCVGVVTAWPFLLLLAALIWLFVRFRRNRKKKKQAQRNS